MPGVKVQHGPDSMLTVKAVANRLGVSYTTARRLVQTGKLRSLQVKTVSQIMYRVHPEWLDEYIRENMKGE